MPGRPGLYPNFLRLSKSGFWEGAWLSKGFWRLSKTWPWEAGLSPGFLRLSKSGFWEGAWLSTVFWRFSKTRPWDSWLSRDFWRFSKTSLMENPQYPHGPADNGIVHLSPKSLTGKPPVYPQNTALFQSGGIIQTESLLSFRLVIALRADGAPGPGQRVLNPGRAFRLKRPGPSTGP